MFRIEGDACRLVARDWSCEVGREALSQGIDFPAKSFEKIVVSVPENVVNSMCIESEKRRAH